MTEAQPELTEYDDSAAGRPTLLTVLCILTFVGSSIGILTNIYSYARANRTASEYQEIRQKVIGKDSLSVKDTVKEGTAVRRKSPFMERFVEEAGSLMTVQKIHEKAIGSIISYLFTLIGAILMWNLLRTGFYLYIAGIVIDVGIPLILFHGNHSAFPLSFISLFFGLLFIILYALNISSLRK